MTRSGSLASHQRPVSWVIVAASLVAYLGLLAAVGMTGLLLEIPLPWWVAQAAPPLFYALLVLAFVRPRSTTSICGGALLLWAVHLLLGMLTQPLLALVGSPGATGSTWSFPPAPLPEILWVPVLLVPLRDLLRGMPPSRPAHPQSSGGRRSVTDQRAASTSAAAPVLSSRPSAAGHIEAALPPARTPLEKPRAAQARTSTTTAVTSMTVTSMEPRLEVGRRPAVAVPVPVSAPQAAPEGGGAAPAEATTAEAPAEARTVAPTQAQRLTDTLLARDTSDEPLRLSLARVLGQLPAEALAVPADRLDKEPAGYLFAPRRMVLAQLSSGVVCAHWDLLAPQIPSHLLAMSHEAIATALPDGNCILPLDEIVRQLSPEIFLPVGPAPDIRGIEVFPAPFQPLGANRTEDSTEVEVLPAPIVTASAEPEPLPAPAQVMPASGAEVGQVDAMKDGLGPVEAMNDALAIGEHESTSHEHLIAPSSALAPPEDEEQQLAPALEDIDDLRSDVAEVVPAVANRRELHEERRAVSKAPDDLHVLRGLTARLPAVGPLAVEVHAVDGVSLLTATSPAVDVEAVRTVTAHLLPILLSARAAWPVDQITLRSTRAAFVITPLGSLPAGAPVLAVSIPSGGGLALIEVRSRQVAAAHVAQVDDPSGDVGTSGEERDEPDLLDVEPSTRTRELASSLGALGTVTASSLRDAETDRTLYLFLPPGSDVRALGALAHDVSAAMRQAAEAGVMCRTAVLRSAARRMVIRLPAGRSDTLVAAGETAKPGLAYRQVDHAAATLGAL
jgi:hypothetical protein